jgi:hypothetical protein
MKRPLTYLDGIGTGVAAIAMLVMFWLSAATAELEQAYQGLGSRNLPAITKIVLATAWRLGMPAVFVGALVAAHVWRPRMVFLAIAVAAIAVDVFWYLAAWAPVFEIAGNIR